MVFFCCYLSLSDYGVETNLEGAQGFAEGPSNFMQCRFSIFFHPFPFFFIKNLFFLKTFILVVDYVDA